MFMEAEYNIINLNQNVESFANHFALNIRRSKISVSILWGKSMWVCLDSLGLFGFFISRGERGAFPAPTAKKIAGGAGRVHRVPALAL